MLSFEQHNRLLDNLGSPAAPLAWFARGKKPAGPVGWLFDLAKWIALVLWALLFVWIWFPVFSVLFLYEGLGFVHPETGGPAEPKSAAPAESESHG